jgi:hypothetical protein
MCLRPRKSETLTLLEEGENVQTDTDSQRTNKLRTPKRQERKQIDWKSWNPFQRATGEALRQLNQRQRKQNELDTEEALL